MLCIAFSLLINNNIDLFLHILLTFSQSMIIISCLGILQFASLLLYYALRQDLIPHSGPVMNCNTPASAL